jgi:hypothetical protein
VDLDHQSIERRDFPISRRGYEPAAVDAHLRALATAVYDLQQALDERHGESLGAAAAGQVQSILEAAETTAADMERQAAHEAAATRQAADHDAQHTRNDAVARAQAHVQAVSQATAVLLEKVESMDQEVGALVQSLRAGAGRLAADLRAVEVNMGELYDVAAAGGGGAGAVGAGAVVAGAGAVVASTGAVVASTGADAGVVGAGAVDASVVGDTGVVVAADMRARADTAHDSPAQVAFDPPLPSGIETAQDTAFSSPMQEGAGSQPAPAAAGAASNGSAASATHAAAAEAPRPTTAPEVALGRAAASEATPARASSAGGEDLDGARLIALNMALNGEPREQADRYLADIFALADRQKLLDEVYAAIEG